MSNLSKPGLRWLISILVIALANYVSGRLGLLLALPPGFATAVWPPSGIALAAVLLFGNSVWPGVWLGSFAMNIWIAAQAGPIAEWDMAIVVAGTIGAGSSLQAVFGAWLVRRFVGFPNALVTARAIGLFLLLGGPVGCVVAATVGVTTLAALGILPWPAFAFQWWNWWVGDSIGVLVVAPLVLIAFSEPRQLWRARALTVGLPMTLAFALAVIFFTYSSRVEQQRLDAKLDQQMQTVAGAIRVALDVKLDFLYSSAGLFEANAKLKRAEFERFVQRISPRMSGIQGVSWVPKVAHGQRAVFEKAARDDGFASFSFTDWVGELPKRARDRPEYFPVYYVEPYAGNERALGYDLGGHPIRRQTLEQARDTGLPVASGPLTLVQETGNQRGVLLVHPVYTDLPPQPTEQDRRDHLAGYVTLILRIGDLVHHALLPFRPRGLVIAMKDESAGEGFNQLLAAQAADAPPEGGPPVVRAAGGTWWTQSLTVLNRQWVLKLAPTAAAAAEQRSFLPWAMLAGGLLTTGFLGALLLAVTGRRYQVGS